MSPPTAVLLMAYGGPDSLADVEPFLLDIRGGRPTSPELVEEIRGRYAAIGGRSPLLEISRAQAAGLQARLDAEEPGVFQTYTGMRHWRPYIREAVAEIAAAGHRLLVALCLAPHYSAMSIGAYMGKLDQALAEHPEARLQVRRVESWHDHPLFLDALAAKLRRGLERWPQARRGGVRVLFTAHSLPAVILERGDPYPRQLEETARGVAERVGQDLDWRFCYQSSGASAAPPGKTGRSPTQRGRVAEDGAQGTPEGARSAFEHRPQATHPRTPIPWLGPAIEEVIREEAAAGRRDLLVCPVGFVADHVEVLYDLDIEARQIAAEAGVRLERTESPNTDPTFLAALADLVRREVPEGEAG